MGSHKRHTKCWFFLFVCLFFFFFFFFLDILRFWQKWYLEKEIFNLIQFAIGYSKWKLWHFKVDEVQIVHFEKNLFEDIWVDDGGKSLAAGTKYKPKTTEIYQACYADFSLPFKVIKSVLSQYLIL